MTCDLKMFLSHLKTANIFPKSIEAARWHNWNLVSCFDDISNAMISDLVYMGVDQDPQIAFAKAVTEYCERTLARRSSDPITKLTERSDGFAAFPVSNGDYDTAAKRARENALNEAVERFLWGTWWDNKSVRYQVCEPDSSVLSGDFQSLVRDFGLQSLREIQIDDANAEFRLSIFIAENRHGGFVTGGACSKVNEILRRYVPAFGELLRHLMVMEKMVSSRATGTSFYEKRLHGFGMGAWRKLVLDRLGYNGSIPIQLPRLVVDQAVQHSAPELIHIHRCLFEYQPPFIGGALERLCI
jgi:hypothetical protein